MSLADSVWVRMIVTTKASSASSIGVYSRHRFDACAYHNTLADHILNIIHVDETEKEKMIGPGYRKCLASGSQFERPIWESDCKQSRSIAGSHSSRDGMWPDLFI